MGLGVAVEGEEVLELFRVTLVGEGVPFGRATTDDVVDEAEGCRLWGRWSVEGGDPGLLLFVRVGGFVGLDDWEGLVPF